MSALGQRQEKPRRLSYSHDCGILDVKTISLLERQLIAFFNFTFSISPDEDAAPGPISRHAIRHVRRLAKPC